MIRQEGMVRKLEQENRKEKIREKGRREYREEES